MPPGAQLMSVQELPSGFTLVTFGSPMSLHDSLGYAITTLQSAGYTVGRGSTGPSDTHLPFTKQDRPGVIRLVPVTSCTTRWEILA
jgi:hypothetical protein